MEFRMYVYLQKKISFVDQSCARHAHIHCNTVCRYWRHQHQSISHFIWRCQCEIIEISVAVPTSHWYAFADKVWMYIRISGAAVDATLNMCVSSYFVAARLLSVKLKLILIILYFVKISHDPIPLYDMTKRTKPIRFWLIGCVFSKIEHDTPSQLWTIHFWMTHEQHIAWMYFAN